MPSTVALLWMAPTAGRTAGADQIVAALDGLLRRDAALITDQGEVKLVELPTPSAALERACALLNLAHTAQDRTAVLAQVIVRVGLGNADEPIADVLGLLEAAAPGQAVATSAFVSSIGSAPPGLHGRLLPRTFGDRGAAVTKRTGFVVVPDGIEGMPPFSSLLGPAPQPAETPWLVKAMRRLRRGP